MKLLKLKNGEVYKISDVYFAKEVELILNNPEIPEDAEIKKGNRIVLKKCVEGLFDYEESKFPKYYKVVTSAFNEISIDEEELPKAVWSFHKNQGASFKNGSCSQIRDILCDKIKTMGWNDNYYSGNKIKPEDQENVEKTLGRGLEIYLAKVKSLCASVKDVKQLQEKLSSQKLLN